MGVVLAGIVLLSLGLSIFAIYVFFGTTPIIVNVIGGFDWAPEWFHSSNFWAWVIVVLLWMIVLGIFRFILNAGWGLLSVIIFLVSRNVLMTVNIVGMLGTLYFVGTLIFTSMVNSQVISWFVLHDQYGDFKDNWFMAMSIWLVMVATLNTNRKKEKSAQE